MLLEGATAAEVAKALGKGKRTIDRWRASQPFKDALSRVNAQVEQKVVSESSDRIANIKNLALDTIEQCLSDPEESMRNRLNAARLAQNLTSAKGDIGCAIDTFVEAGLMPDEYAPQLISVLEETEATLKDGVRKVFMGNIPD